MPKPYQGMTEDNLDDKRTPGPGSVRAFGISEGKRSDLTEKNQPKGVDENSALKLHTRSGKPRSKT